MSCDQIKEFITICNEGLKVTNKSTEEDQFKFIQSFISLNSKKFNKLYNEIDTIRFENDLKKYNLWLAKDIVYHGCRYLMVEIKNIDWDKKIIEWNNINGKFPHGTSIFRSFHEDFIPFRE